MKIKYIIYIVVIALTLALAGCSEPGGNSPGSEYMPDMAHSIAYEANYYTYYYNNTWGSEDEYYKYAQPRLPVKGTVARAGNTTGQSSITAIAHTAAGSVPYYYGDTDAERERAIAEIIDNPYPITEAGLARGKELYNVFCGICHGEKGDGAGYLVRDPSPGDLGGKYPVQPANLLQDEFITASNGRYYHALMHGKNLMGAYKDKLSSEERWQVIHYVRSLHAKEKGLTYNQMENTLNSIDRPAGVIAAVSTDHHDHGAGHSHDHEHGDDGEHTHHGEDAHDHNDHEKEHSEGDHGGDHGDHHDEHHENHEGDHDHDEDKKN